MRPFASARKIGIAMAGGPAAAERLPGPGARTDDTHSPCRHGADRQPEPTGAPDFSRGLGLLKSDAAQIEAIRFGIGNMPGFDGVIGNEDVINALYQIRALDR